MMGKQNKDKEMFIYNVDINDRVRKDHPLRRISDLIDFSFVRKEVEHCYGYNGNLSVDPEIIMKMMFLLFYDDIASERELMPIISERLDYMWFLGYGLNDEIPNHSVLSKARKRWGIEVFEELFVRIIWQCNEAGLIDGNKIHMDGSLIDANASKNSILKGPPELIKQLKKIYKKEEIKLEDREDKPKKYKKINDGLVSKTDPDAAIVYKQSKGSRPRYKNHRVVDNKKGVITAIETTSGDIEENSRLLSLARQHEKNTGYKTDTIIADSQYGTVDNFRKCSQRGIRSHMSDLRLKQSNRNPEIFGEEKFIYNAQRDTYICPNNAELTRRKHKRKRQAYEYSASRKTCRDCQIRSQCTKAKDVTVRTIKRHYNQELINKARTEASSLEAKRDRMRRKWIMEGSFADAANNHSFKRSRWRRLNNQKIQDYLIAAIQNIRILVKHIEQSPAVAVAKILGFWGQFIIKLKINKFSLMIFSY